MKYQSWLAVQGQTDTSSHRRAEAHAAEWRGTAYLVSPMPILLTYISLCCPFGKPTQTQWWVRFAQAILRLQKAQSTSTTLQEIRYELYKGEDRRAHLNQREKEETTTQKNTTGHTWGKKGRVYNLQTLTSGCLKETIKKVSLHKGHLYWF